MILKLDIIHKSSKSIAPKKLIVIKNKRFIPSIEAINMISTNFPFTIFAGILMKVSKRI